MRRNNLITATLAVIGLALSACQGEQASLPEQPVEDAPTPRQGGWCGPGIPPEPSGTIDEDVIARVEALPYWASTVLDLPNDEEILGNALLTVEPDEKVVLRLTTTDVDLRRSVFAELDLGAALEHDSGFMFAELYADNEPFGSISINGESGLFLQGSLNHAKLEVQPSGVFALELEPGQLDAWPPDTKLDADGKKTLDTLQQTIRVVGRLHGSCMQTLQNGAQARVMDIDEKPQCAELLAYL